MLLVALSLLFQIAAASLAIRLAIRTGRALAWTLVAAAIALMALRRIMTIAQAIGPHHKPIDPATEGIALCISILLLLALMAMRPLIGRWSAAAEDAARMRSAVFDAAPAEIAVIDARGRLISVNRAWSDFAPAPDGAPVPRFVGWNYLEVCRKAAPTCPGAESIGEGIRAVLAGELQAFESSYTMETHEGVRTFLLRVVPLTSTERGAVVSHVELTRILAAERRVAELETRSRQIIETMIDGVWMIDAEARTTFVNAQMAAMLGYTPEEMLGRHLFDFMDEDARSISTANLDRRAQGVAEQHDFRLRHRDGRSVWTLMSTNPVQDDTGTYRGALAIVTNIDARKQAEQALQASEQRYRSLVEITHTGFLIVDGDGRVLVANEEYLRLTGRGSLGEILGRPVTEWTAPHDLERNAAAVRECVTSGSTEDLEIDYLRTDGSIVPIEINAATLSDGTIIALCRDISARRNALQALKDSEDRYALAMTGTRAGIWDWDVVTGHTRLFPEWKRLLGYEDDELENHVSTWERLLHPDDRARTHELVRLHFEHRQPYVTEYRMRARDGTWRWFLVHGQARWDEQGRPVRMAGSTIDITAQKLAEQALHTMEARFHQLAEGSAEVFWLFQLEPAELLYISPSFERIWGISPEEASANPKQWLGAVHPDDQAAVGQAWSDLIASEGQAAYDIEYRICHRDGSVRWIHDRATLIRGTETAATLVSGIAGDVTERRRLEDAERELHQRVVALIDASPLPIVTASAEGIVTGWNPSAERVFGYSEREALGRYLPIISEDEQEQYRTFLNEVFAGRAFLGRQVRRRHRNGTYLDVVLTTAPLRGSDGRVIGSMAIYEDVTERRRIEELNRQLQDRMLESQKLESLGVLAGGIAHDFNNLLTLILGNTHLARAEVSPRSSAFESLQQVELATLRASELTAQMLAYAGKGRFVIGPVDLAAVLRSSTPLLEAALPGEARLVLDLAADLPVIEADPAQLQQVIVNLVTNAGEALTGDHRVVTIRTGTCHADLDYLATTVLPEDQVAGTFAYIEVTDTGTGMNEEVRRRMFEPFYSTRFSGRGLGLAAVLGIVRRHRGTVSVVSAPGHGTTVRVLFPASAGAPRTGGRTDARGVQEVSAEVLLVDDEAGVLTLMRRFLERAGYSVRTAASGEEGVARFRESRGSLSAVILDLNMPGMGGDAALQAIRALEPTLPVIVTSGYSEEEVGRRCAGARISAFLPKPYLPAELIEEVRRAVTGARPRRV